MEVESSVPATPEDLALDRDFVFTAGKYRFTIQPLTLREYYDLERKINASILALVNYGIGYDEQIARVMGVREETLEQIKKSVTIVTLLNNLIHISPLKKFKILLLYNLQTRSHFAFSMEKYFEYTIPIHEILNLASYFFRYSGEIKKKLLDILQNGIPIVTQSTQERRKTSSVSSAMDMMLDSLYVGGIPDDLEESGTQERLLS
jgi:hypothetical protein